MIAPFKGSVYGSMVRDPVILVHKAGISNASFCPRIRDYDKTMVRSATLKTIASANL